MSESFNPRFLGILFVRFLGFPLFPEENPGRRGKIIARGKELFWRENG